ncbi:MAG: hypothetical protein Q9170_002901 [Blastenia crenularia]
MAELSIVGFFLGSLSFVVTVRNSVDRVLQDTDAYKTQPEGFERFSSKLMVLAIHLRSWRDFWNIYDKTPTEIFKSYWGDTGSEQIRRLLSHIHRQFEKVNAEFELNFGDHIRHRTTRGGLHGHLYSKKVDIESLENVLDSSTRKSGRLQRVKTALFTGPIFQKHLETLDASVNLLHELSKNCFVEHVCGYKDTAWEHQVEYIAARSHLTHLAHSSTFASQALQDLVKTSDGHNVDYYLEHGFHPDQRQRKF